jgi:NAD(P)-dependent dehydrogenase (short-subunit alcohol dehydrogenase family)
VKEDVLVVTGAASGIGEELARRLAAEWTVVAADLPERLPEVEALAASHDVHPVAADVSRPFDVDRLFDAATRLGPLHGVVSCAGVTRQRRSARPTRSCSTSSSGST